MVVRREFSSLRSAVLDSSSRPLSPHRMKQVVLPFVLGLSNPSQSPAANVRSRQKPRQGNEDFDRSSSQHWLNWVSWRNGSNSQASQWLQFPPPKSQNHLRVRMPRLQSLLDAKGSFTYEYFHGVNSPPSLRAFCPAGEYPCAHL
jgi:hypothetical protein